MIIEAIILILVLILFVIFIIEFYNIIFRGFAPFIVTRSKVIKKIIEEMEIDAEANVIEIGCGSAGFLRAVHKKFPKAKLTGVDHSIIAYITAGIQNVLGKNKIKVIRANIFDIDLSEADVIYCYLNVGMMKDLEKKFKKECKHGAQIISFTFSLPNIEPYKKFNVSGVGEKLFFYKM